MKKIFSVFLIFILVFSCVSCFATTMSESEIKTAFNDSIINGDIEDSEEITSSELSYLTNTISNYLSSNNISGNYIQYIFRDANGAWLYYYDLGNSTLSSYSNNQFYFSGTVTEYSINCIADDNDWGSVGSDTVSSFYSNYTLGNSFDTTFTYSSNAIFTEPSGGGLFDNIIGVMTSILGYIVPVATALLAIPLFKFIIYASIAIGIIYFVLKLLKSFTGNKLNKSIKN